MKHLKHIIMAIIGVVLLAMIGYASQTWTDDTYDGTHVAATDLQNIENNFACLKSSFSGASSPSDDVAGQWWYDLTNHVLKLRNEADSGYLEVWDLTNDRPLGLDKPGPIGDDTPAFGGFTTLEAEVLALDSNTESLSGNKTISTGDPQIQFLDPDGSSRNVELPPEASNDGRPYVIVNTADASEDLVVKDDGGSTIETIGQNQAGIFGCDGTDWKTLSALGAGGAGQNMIFVNGSGDVEYEESSGSYVTQFTFYVYIPASNPGKIYMKPRTYGFSGSTVSLKFTVNATDSTESIKTNSSYAWQDEIYCDVSGESEGLQPVAVKMKSSGISYLQGFSFRWGS